MALATTPDVMVPLSVTMVQGIGRRLVSVPGTVLSRTSGAVLIRFERRRPYVNPPGALTALLTSIDGAGHAVLLKALDAPGRLNVDGGREITFAFLMRDGATSGFLAAIDQRQRSARL
jgi:hypothetical protein